MDDLLFLLVFALVRLLPAIGVLLLLWAGLQALVAVAEWDEATLQRKYPLASARRIGAWGVGFLLGDALIFGLFWLYLALSGTGGHP